MRFHTKSFTSLFLTVTFVALSLSGIVLYAAPRCRVAEQTGWTVIALQKSQWESIHINGALFFTLATVLHLVLNWPLLWGYIKKGMPSLNMKLELLAAVVLGGLVLSGSIFAWPPFRSVVELHEQIKDSWGRPPRQAPAFHTGSLTVRELSTQMRLATDQVIEALEAEGLVVPDAETTIGQVADENRLTPEAIREAIRWHFPGAGPDRDCEVPGRGVGGGGGQGRGLGRGRGKPPHP